jgi:hypothetical protein
MEEHLLTEEIMERNFQVIDLIDSKTGNFLG